MVSAGPQRASMVFDDAGDGQSKSAVLRPVGTPQSLRTRKIRGAGAEGFCLLADGSTREWSSPVKGKRGDSFTTKGGALRLPSGGWTGFWNRNDRTGNRRDSIDGQRADGRTS